MAGLNGHRPERAIWEHHATARFDDPLGGMIAADVATFLPDDYLVKVDRASMAHGVEVRPLLVDHEVMELAARTPSRWKIARGETKWILKQTFQDHLPSGVLGRPKQGFEIPIDAWLRGPLRPCLNPPFSTRAPGWPASSNKTWCASCIDRTSAEPGDTATSCGASSSWLAGRNAISHRGSR